MFWRSEIRVSMIDSGFVLALGGREGLGIGAGCGKR